MVWLKIPYIDRKLGPIHCLVLVNWGKRLITSIAVMPQMTAAKNIPVAISKSPFHETMTMN